MDVHTHIAIQ